MKSMAALVAAGLMFPALTFAGVSVNITVGDFDREDNVLVQNEETWYEDAQCSGPYEINTEYQWFWDHGRKVLQFRSVYYNVFTGIWGFGPWQVHVGYYAPARHRVIYQTFSHNYPKEFYSHREYRNYDRWPGKVVKYYRYDPKKSERGEHYGRDYDRPHEYDNHHDYNGNQDYDRHHEDQQAPVRRPNVRPVPQSYNSTMQMNGVAKTVIVNRSEPQQGYRVERTTTKTTQPEKVTKTRIVKVSGRE